MTRLELTGYGVTVPGRTPLTGFDLVLEPGAALAIVGRTRSGKTTLAEALAGLHPRAQSAGRITVPARTALLRPHDNATALATQLARKPQLIIADEPGAGLDPAPRHALLTALQQAGRDHKASLVILTRDNRLPLAMAFDTAVLDAGTIVERGPAETLADRPQHDVTRALVAAQRPRTRTLARPPVSEPLLALEGVTVRQPRTLRDRLSRATPTPVLDSISFEVRRGESIGILGGSGAGKSALLQLAAGIGRASAGHLAFLRRPYRGRDLPREAQAKLTLVFPNPHAAFNPGLPVGLSLTEPLRVEEQLLIDEQADSLADAVRVVGFSPDALSRLPAAFTSVELQRLALARALVGRPALIMLDEPTAMLDPVDEAEFLTVFNRIRSDYGITVLVASRRLEVLRLLVDRVHVLDHGRLVETGTPTQLQQEATHPATKALLASPFPGPLPEPVAEPEPIAPPEAPVQPETAAPPVMAEPVAVTTPDKSEASPVAAEQVVVEPATAAQSVTAEVVMEVAEALPAEPVEAQHEPALADPQQSPVVEPPPPAAPRIFTAADMLAPMPAVGAFTLAPLPGAQPKPAPVEATPAVIEPAPAEPIVEVEAPLPVEPIAPDPESQQEPAVIAEAAATDPAAADPQPTPEPAATEPPPPSPAPRSRKRADEGSESWEAQLAVEGRSNRSRRVEAVDDDAWG